LILHHLAEALHHHLAMTGALIAALTIRLRTLETGVPLRRTGNEIELEIGSVVMMEAMGET
jgi:hypothetical protein